MAGFVINGWDWIKDRFALERIYRNVLNRRVAKGAWYFGDGASLFLLFIVLVTTGAALTLGYTASPEKAYDSVRQITYTDFFGGFIRGLHYWSAGLMVVLLCFHMLRQVMIGGYKSPREGSWLIGVFIFFAVITMSLLGYVLRWDERGIYGLRVALNIFYRVPIIGDDLVQLVQGGRQICGRTLSRVYSVHVIFGPLLIMGLIAFHLYLVVVHSVTSPTERKRRLIRNKREQRAAYRFDAHSDERGEVFFPETTAKSGLMAAIVLVVGLTLTVLFGPGRLYPEANLHHSSLPREEWWWSWFSSIAAYLPPALASYFYVGFPIMLFLCMIALPFVERSPYRGIRHRPIASTAVACCVIGLLGLTSLRIRSPWTGWPDPVPPPVPAGATLSPQAEKGRFLFAEFGCNSCHAVDGHGPQVGPDLARLTEVRSLRYLRRYIQQPPPGVAMPAYQGRFSDEELQQLASFVLVLQITKRR